MVSMGEGRAVLVNNAGVYEPHPITETTYDRWQRAWQDTLAVNLIAGERGAQRRAESPLGRVTTSEEVAAAVVSSPPPKL